MKCNTLCHLSKIGRGVLEIMKAIVEPIDEPKAIKKDKHVAEYYEKKEILSTTQNSVTLKVIGDNFELNNIQQFSNQNCAIAGSQGSGKTVTIKTILNSYYQSKNNTKLLIIDYKDDYSREDDFYQLINAKAILADEVQIPINPLIKTRADKEPIRDVSYRFVSLISASYPIMGGNQKEVLLTFTKDYLVKCDKKESIPNIYGLFDYMEENQPDNGFGAWFTDVFRPLVDFRVFSEKEETMETIFNDDKNFVFNVTRSSEEHKILISLSIVFLLKQYMLTNGKATYNGNYRNIKCVLVVDEASELMAVSNNSEFKTFIQMARQYGFPFIFGFQALGELAKNKKIDWEEMISLRMQGYSQKSPLTSSLEVGSFMVESAKFKGEYKVIPYFKER